jgi:agmatine deiminase
MKKENYLLILIGILLIGCSQEPKSTKITLPSEWSMQERVHLAWFGNERRDSVLCRTIEALQSSIPLTLNIPADSLKSSICNYMSAYKIDTSKIDFVVDPETDFWTRDPIFFVIENDSLKMTCFNYSMYGIFPQIEGVPIPDVIKKIGEYDERLAKKLNIPIIKSDFVFEGGGIESNGKGTLMIIKEMALQRNPGKSITEIEKELHKVLGAKKIIWLKNGLIEDKTFENYAPFYKNYFGGGANMHVDELCRFINESTVILPEIPIGDISKSPVDSINYFILEENYKILKNATTADGQPLTIHRLPMPEIEQLKYTIVLDSLSADEMKPFGFNVGDTIFRIPACSYENFFISNKVVLIPKYWLPGMSESQKQKDLSAKLQFKKLFPDKDIVQIYTLPINRGGGGIHCMTHEQPKVGTH